MGQLFLMEQTHDIGECGASNFRLVLYEIAQNQNVQYSSSKLFRLAHIFVIQKDKPPGNWRYTKWSLTLAFSLAFSLAWRIRLVIFWNKRFNLTEQFVQFYWAERNGPVKRNKQTARSRNFNDELLSSL